MSRSVQGRVKPGAGGETRVRETNRIDPSDRVVHFDQLTDDEQLVFLHARRDGRLDGPRFGLEAVDVVVYTEYYRLN